MCGDDGPLPMQDAVNPLYAVRVETMPAYDPLAVKDLMADTYRRTRGYTPHTPVEHHLAQHDLLDGTHGHHAHSFQQGGYQQRERPEMMYRRDDLAILTHAHDSAAMQASQYMGAWRQMQFNAGSN